MHGDYVSSVLTQRSKSESNIKSYNINISTLRQKDTPKELRLHRKTRQLKMVVDRNIRQTFRMETFNMLDLSFKTEPL